MIDCLAHLDDPRVDEVDALLLRARDAGVSEIVHGGVAPGTARLGYGLEGSVSPRVWRAYGVHPLTVERRSPEAHLKELERALKEGQPVAVGEIGLDGREGFPGLEIQQTLLEAQLELARSYDLPVILHCVQATRPLIALLKRCGLPDAGGMVHGFTGSLETAAEFLRLGLHISFGGMVTRPASKRCRAAAAGIPAHRLLVESDCPDHPPLGSVGEWSEPAHISVTLQELARLRGEPAGEFMKSIEANARALFGFPPLAERGGAGNNEKTC